MRINKKSVLQTFLYRSFIFLIISSFISFQSPVYVLAQYTGGSYGGDEESSLSGGLYTGGPQQGSSSNISSSAGSLAHGEATHLLFTQSPSATKHTRPLERQPIVEIRDANNNRVISDNSSKVTVALFNNPGNAVLAGTMTVTVSGGVATFIDLGITKTAENYTLIATSPGVASAVSEPFDILPGTGPKAIAVWDDDAKAGTGGYTIFTWLVTNDNREDLLAGDTSSIIIYNSLGGTEKASTALTIDATNDWFKTPNGEWSPSNELDSYFIDMTIVDNNPSATTYNAYAPLETIKPSLSKLAANFNWDDVISIKAKTDTINWDEIEHIRFKTNDINWDDIGVIRTDAARARNVIDSSIVPVNWDDITVMSKAGINWNDIDAMSDSRVNWDDLFTLTRAGVNWSDLNVLTKAGINWSDLNVLTKAGINWNDLDVLSDARINWDDMQVLSKAGVNWSDLNILTKAGVNWSDIDIMSRAAVNWNDIAVMSGAKVSWSQTINWDSLAELTTAGVNWNDMQVMTEGGVNWDDLKVMTQAGINWEDIESMSDQGINWDDLQVLSKAGVNWSDIDILNDVGINWDDIQVLSKAGVNWGDIDAFTEEDERLRMDAAKAHYNMGNIYFQRGEYEIAAREYYQAVTLMPDDPDAHYNLAFVSGEHLGDNRTALKHYQMYLYLNPDAKDAHLVKEKIAKAELTLRSKVDSPLDKTE